MLKFGTVILGLGLALSLAACEKPAASAPAPEKAPETATSSELSKPEARRSREGGEGRRTPPEAAYAACESLAIGENCSVETPRGTREGICRTRESADRTFCGMARRDRSEGGRPARSQGDRPARPEGGRPGGRGQK